MSKKRAHIPMRRCIGCSESFPKKTLNRLYIEKDEILVDEFDKVEKRCVYLCKSLECLLKAFKKKAFERNFKREVSKEIKEQFKERFYEK